MLEIERSKNPTPKMHVVKTFPDVLPAVSQIPISQQKSESSELEIFRMFLGDSIAHKGNSYLVQFAPPFISLQPSPHFDGPINLGVCERFITTVVPPPAGKNANLRSDLLFGVNAKPILHTALFA